MNRHPGQQFSGFPPRGFGSFGPYGPQGQFVTPPGTIPPPWIAQNTWFPGPPGPGFPRFRAQSPNFHPDGGRPNFPFSGTGTHGGYQPRQRFQGNGAQGSNNVNLRRQQKKQKVDKRDLTEYPFYCDICDRGFKTEDKHKEHTDGHEKCSVEGCSYIAAPKLVRLHFQLQHRTGLAKKIWSLESKPDIQKWIEERKRKFPTRENIAKKMALKKNKIERGEVLENKDMRNLSRKEMYKQKRQRHRQGRRGGGQGVKTTNTSRESTTVNSKSIEPQSVSKQDPSIDPLAFVLGEKNSSESDEEGPSTVSSKTAPGTLLGTGLASLAAYGSSDDETFESDKKPDSKLSDSQRCDLKNVEDNIETVNASRYSKAEEKPERNTPKRNRKRNAKKHQQQIPQKRKSTLLQKLLASEMRHERNVILQCVRHVVKKDFFDTGQK